MFRNKVYYEIKPLLPVWMRRATRRWVTQRKRNRVKDIWPILPGSQAPPVGWPGWPQNRRFAFVLTHDVEGPGGLAKCRQLMKCEMKLGFRSCFNFIPEGPYGVPKSLRDELTTNGFEIGVHDLRHDGKLYRSRREFARNAQRINRYLKDWGAVGFRSGFMLHNLDWAHDLDLLYEASTFDTDPFEPQPDGLQTIFPKWIPRPDSGNGQSHAKDLKALSGCRRGYLELPYTLAQDSTLFLLLAEQTPEIWFKKVEWLAAQGGMVLVDTHPDYMAFQGSRNGHWEYPIALYEQLLQHLASNYREQFWHALPKEVALYWHQVMP
jgi:hypothetical protein